MKDYLIHLEYEHQRSEYVFYILKWNMVTIFTGHESWRLRPAEKVVHLYVNGIYLHYFV